jgi:hypothetical protein
LVPPHEGPSVCHEVRTDRRVRDAHHANLFALVVERLCAERRHCAKVVGEFVAQPVLKVRPAVRPEVGDGGRSGLVASATPSRSQPPVVFAKADTTGANPARGSAIFRSTNSSSPCSTRLLRVVVAKVSEGCAEWVEHQ